MEKAIEIKRRAQRCILNGDLDGALSEYERLVASGDSDPYHSVLLADLLYKKGDQDSACQRYLEAVEGYQKSGLLKNAIAVCKKMSRLSFAPTLVLQRLAELHALDGFATEASLYYMQHADAMLTSNRIDAAIDSLRKAFQVHNDNVKALERLSDALQQKEQTNEAVRVLLDAAHQYDRQGMLQDAKRCRTRAERLKPGSTAEDHAAAPAVGGLTSSDAEPEPEYSIEESEIEAAEEAHELPPVYRMEDEAPVEARQEPETTGYSPHSFGDLEFKDEPIRPPAPDAAPPILRGAPAPREEPPVLPTMPMEEERFSGIPSFEIDAEDAAASPLDVLSSLDLTSSRREAPPRLPEARPPEPPPAAAEPAFQANDAFDIERLDLDTSPPSPGLTFEAAQPLAPAPAEPAPMQEAAAEDLGLGEISTLLTRAQELFRTGDREGASEALLTAAQAYDGIGRYESAASIYRSLSQTSAVSLQLMTLWLKNCQHRADHHEASRVACELGDRSLNVGKADSAREWFERARAFDPSNETAARRLQRLDQPRPAVPTVGAAPATNPNGSPGPAPAPTRLPFAATPVPVDVQMDKSIPENVDLGILISEFQRSVSVELAGDAQSHYDLAMSYREMGLYDQAIESFEISAREPAFRVRSTEMIGRCMLEMGRFEEAARALRSAISEPGLSPDSGLSLRYQLALALEAGGQGRQALGEFERIYSVSSSYADVAVRIRTLRKSMELA